MTNLPKFVSRFAARSGGWTFCQSMNQFSWWRDAFARSLFLVVLGVTVVRPILGQALPAAEAAPISTGFALPRTAGTLNYAVSASESLTFGYYGSQNAYPATNLSGDVAFLSSSKLYPFSMIFSGGHSFASSEQPSYTFLNLAVSQVINVKRWNFLLSDNVGYLPGTPTEGLSGVAGVGDLGLNPVQAGADTGQGVLTSYSNRVVNQAEGTVQRQLTSKTSVSGFGSYGFMRFLGTGSAGQGVDYDSTGGGGGISHQLTSRTSFGGNYSYSSFTYPSNGAANAQPGFTSQTASLQLTRQLTHRFNMSVSAGPQWSKVDNPGSSPGLSAYANASLGYAGQFAHASVYYVRGTSSGFGAVGGSLSQSGGISANRTFARVWNCAVNASYGQTSSLPSASVTFDSFDTAIAGVQVSRAIMRSLSAFASYTFEHQSSPSNTAVDAFSGSEQVVGFGLTYSPSSIHVGRQ